MSIDEALRHIHRMGGEPGRTLREQIAVDTVIRTVKQLQGEAAVAAELRWELGMTEDEDGGDPA